MAEASGSFRAAIRAEVDNYIRGRANASADAQRDNEGLGIEMIRRGVGRASLERLAVNVAVSATAFAPLSTPLTLDIVLSGRPLLVMVTGTCIVGTGGTSWLAVDVRLRKVSISGAVNGMYYQSVVAAHGFTALEVVRAPEPGLATLEVVALRGITDGTIYTDVNNRLVLIAEEL